jgi:hypothetical protein
MTSILNVTQNHLFLSMKSIKYQSERQASSKKTKNKLTRIAWTDFSQFHPNDEVDLVWQEEDFDGRELWPKLDTTLSHSMTLGESISTHRYNKEVKLISFGDIFSQ